VSDPIEKRPLLRLLRQNPIRVLAVAAAIGLAVILFSKPSPHALLNEPAPAVQLERLEGGRASLEQDIGSKIVVLDFFATWCPPCRESLPAYDAVYRDYRDKGVVVYAVNLREGPDLVRGFMEGQGIGLPVLMDPYGDAADAFRVSSIPQSVVIDRNGIIRKVEVGFYGGSEQALRRTLDRLLKEETAT